MSTPSFGGGGGGKKMPRNRKVLLFSLGGLGAIGGYIWWKKRNASTASAASTTDPNAIDPATGIPYSQEGGAIDPATGVPYADEYGGTSGAYGTQPGALGTYDPLTGQYIPGIGQTTPPVQIATNAEWAQAAESYLVSQGYDPVTTAAAIGAYLIGGTLTSDQYAIVQAALAFEGQPPTSVPPPKTTGGGGTGQGTISVPNVVNHSSHVAVALITAAGLTAVLDPPTPTGMDGIISAQSPTAGTKVTAGTTVTLTNVLHAGGGKKTPPKKSGDG